MKPAPAAPVERVDAIPRGRWRGRGCCWPWVPVTLPLSVPPLRAAGAQPHAQVLLPPSWRCARRWHKLLTSTWLQPLQGNRTGSSGRSRCRHWQIPGALSALQSDDGQALLAQVLTRLGLDLWLCAALAHLPPCRWCITWCFLRLGLITMDATTADPLVLVLTTEADEGERSGPGAGGAKLAACVSRLPVRSTYRWQAQLESAQEVQLLIKTSRAGWPIGRRG